MKKLSTILIMTLFLIGLGSAAISLETQPTGLYNLNDKIEITASIIPDIELNDVVILTLSCDENEVEVYKEFLYLTEPTTKDIIIPLLKEFIGELKGTCVIKSKIGDNKATISEPFEISDLITIKIDNANTPVIPGTIVSITGTAIKENLAPSTGIIEIKVGDFTANTEVINGTFEIKLPLPDNFEAGEHRASYVIQEKNKQGAITNYGGLTSAIYVKQVPSNLEIILDEKNIIPGEALVGKVMLYDQTGKDIKSKVYVAIKNEKEEIIEKIETTTDEKFTYPIKFDQVPSTWTVSTYSEELINKINFVIEENKEVSIDLVNKTLIVENKGNVPYIGIVPINIGDETINVSVNLAIGETSKYSLSAPKGEYTIEATGIKKTVSLTGNAINIEEVFDTNVDGTKIFIWTFIIIILGLASFFFFKQGYNKTFFGRMRGKTKKTPMELHAIPEPAALSNSKIKGELSLSITGTKQNSPIGCISIKNYEDIKEGQGGVRETLETISSLVEQKKGIIYENRGNIFYLLPPVRTKTFDNELPIAHLTESIKEVLDTNNRKFKQKINYGISLNFGTIVTKQEHSVFKFMSMGTLMTTSKKLANRSNGEILMNDKFREKVGTAIKAQRVEIPGMESYEFQGYTKSENDHSGFIKNFVAKQKREGSF
ncbi:MAG: hypothetical protein PF542_04640 [Nanoarchaeota archaeon]|jgi:hypothetical protein|nr:hypothetical protein [Nanoarchaeota archaeon]